VSDTKIEFLLKKILYYGSPRNIQLWDKFSKDLDDEFDREQDKRSEPEPEPPPELPKADFEVAPLDMTKEEDLEVMRLKVFDYMRKYGFSSITISKLMAIHYLKNTDEGELLFAYFLKKKLGEIDRHMYRKQEIIKFVFKPEVREAVYGKGK
jgi:hypothetical protein